MKKYIILAMLLAVCSLGNAQAYKTPITRSGVTMYLDSIVTAYAAGDIVGSTTANTLPMFTTIGKRNASNYSGYFKNLKLTVDSACNATFTLYALKDTTGVRATLALNNGAFKLTSGIASQLIGFTTVTVSSSGTYTAYSASNQKSSGESQWSHAYELNAPKELIYWIAVVNDAWTPPKSGAFQLEVYTEAL